MSNLINTMKATLYNTIQKAKKRSNELIGTELEIEPEITAEIVQNEDEIQMKSEEKEVKEKQEIIEKIKKEEEESEHKMTNYEKELLPYYVGCYSDDPTNLSMKSYLGVVSNPSACINKGKENKLKYVGIQQGDKCYGSNQIPMTSKVDEKYCNMNCNQPETGTCGGYFYNQVYKTDLSLNSSESVKLVENYNSMNSEINNINRNLSNVKYDNSMLDSYPINSYILFVVLMVILIILYLIVEKLIT